MKLFGLTKRDDEREYQRIVLPLKYMKRNGNDCQILPYSGQGVLSRLPVHDKLLMMLSENAEAIISSPINLEDELLRVLNLRKYAKAKLIIDVSENLYEVEHTDATFKSLYLADGLIVSNERLEKLYKEINQNILVLPTGADLEPSKIKPQVEGDIEVLKDVLDKINIPRGVALLPLRDDNYTRCLDNASFLKYASQGIACVTSKLKCFEDAPIQCSSNYEWYEELDKLKSVKYRKEIAEKCLEVAKKHNIKNTVKPLKDWIKQTKFKSV